MKEDNTLLHYTSDKLPQILKHYPTMGNRLYDQMNQSNIVKYKTMNELDSIGISELLVQRERALMFNKYPSTPTESYRMEMIDFGLRGAEERTSYKIKEDPLCLYSKEEYKHDSYSVYSNLTKDKVKEAVEYIFSNHKINSNPF